MHKRYLHHVWTRFRLVKPWYFLVLAVLSAIICVFALRANNEHMVKLRTVVYTADKNNTDIQKPLQDLQAYVTRHMNTNLASGRDAVYPPIQLKYTYDRLVQAQSASTSDANTQLYNEAQHYCEGQNSTDFSGRNRVPCIEQYVTSHTTQQTAIIPDALYKFSFASPRWSPDLAGWSMFATILAAILFILSFATNRLLRHASR